MIIAVAVACLIAAAICLGYAIKLAHADNAAIDQVRQATITKSGGKPASEGETPVAAQSSPIDFTGAAKLAEALNKLNPSGRFLIASFIFAAIAAAAAGVGSVTGNS
jgi:hypothetical protein